MCCFGFLLAAGSRCWSLHRFDLGDPAPQDAPQIGLIPCFRRTRALQFAQGFAKGCEHRTVRLNTHIFLFPVEFRGVSIQICKLAICSRLGTLTAPASEPSASLLSASWR